MNKISIRFFNDREVRAVWDGQIRTKNISKGGFKFANALHFPETLEVVRE